MRCTLQALLNGLLRHEAGGDQHRRVRGVRARSDGRDDNRTMLQHGLMAIDRDRRVRFRMRRRCARGRLGTQRIQRGFKARLDRRQSDAILRTLRPRQCGLDRRQVQRQHIGVRRLGRRGVMPQALLLHVGLDQSATLVAAARQAQVLDGQLVDREDAAGRAVLGRHVGDRGAIRERQIRQARSAELDKLADDAVLAQHLRHAQHEVGRRRAFLQLAHEAHADHLRDQHRHRLAQHRGLGFDATDAPTQHAQAVDHRRVRVRAHDRVGVGPLNTIDLAIHGHARQELEVHLVHDARVRRHCFEVLEGHRAPAQERIALAVALELDLRVLRERIGGAEVVHLHRVVDDQLDRRQRIDLVGITAARLHRVAHRGEVDHTRHTGEVLQQRARRRELNLLVRRGLRVPVAQRFDVGLVHSDAVFCAQQVLQQDAVRPRQLGDSRELGLQGLEARDGVSAAADSQRAARLEGVDHGVVGPIQPTWAAFGRKQFRERPTNQPARPSYRVPSGPKRPAAAWIRAGRPSRPSPSGACRHRTRGTGPRARHAPRAR